MRVYTAMFSFALVYVKLYNCSVQLTTQKTPCPAVIVTVNGVRSPSDDELPTSDVTITFTYDVTLTKTASGLGITIASYIDSVSGS